jgi:hypothetical protein
MPVSSLHHRLLRPRIPAINCETALNDAKWPREMIPLFNYTAFTTRKRHIFRSEIRYTTMPGSFFEENS